RSRLWFESGEYLRALKILFTEKVPIALYHPALKWEVLPGDAAQKPLGVKARLNQDGRVIFTATFDGDKQTDVLAISGLSAVDRDSLLKDFAEIPESFWSDAGKVSDQILFVPVTIRPSSLALRNFLLSENAQLIIMKSMVYGKN